MNWIKHNSDEPPALAPAALVTVGWDHGRLGPTHGGGIYTVETAPWHDVKMYRILRDPEGIPYCSADGLETWAEYVATNLNGQPCQWEARPKKEYLHWEELEYAANEAPDTHRHPGRWQDSLMRVWR